MQVHGRSLLLKRTNSVRTRLLSSSERVATMAEVVDDIPGPKRILLHKLKDVVANWPFGGGADETTTGWMNMIRDIIRFLSVEEPWSVKADEDGIEEADFMIKHADLASALQEKKEALIQESQVQEMTVTYFKNWAENLQGLMLYARPTTVDDVTRLIVACGKLGIKVGSGGAYQTWGPLFPDASTEEQFTLLISNRDLILYCPYSLLNNRIILDKEKMEVAIAPGVTSGELLQVLQEEDLCLTSDVIGQNFTYGGILATGSHGIGKDQPVMADWITSITVVGPDGVKRTFPDDFTDITLPSGVTEDDAMNALRMSLGVFGIIVETSLSVQPIESTVVEHAYPQIGEVFYGPNPTIKKILQDHWSVHMLYFPYNGLDVLGGLLQGLPLIHLWQPRTDQVWLHTVDKVDTYAETQRWEQLKIKLRDTITAVVGGELGSPLIARYPFLTPAFLAAGFQAIMKQNPPNDPKLETLPYAVHYRYGLKFTPVYEMEFGFPLSVDDTEHGYDVFLEAVRYVITELEEVSKPGWLSTKEFPLTSAMDIRVIQKSQCLICPAVPVAGDTSTHTAYIAILSFVGSDAYKEFFKRVAREWMRLGGVPHWAKLWGFLEGEGIFEHVRNHYGENLTKFSSVLDAVNGEGKEMFLNKATKKLVDPVSSNP